MKVAKGFPPRVLLSEVDPVVTLGRRATFLGPRPGPEIPVYLADRGGFETYHGPGQWILFVIAKVETWGGSRTAVRRSIEELLSVGREVAEYYRSDVEMKLDPAGLWVPEGKLASVGISIRDGVLQHGLAINVLPPQADLPAFGGINPCGLATRPAHLCQESGDEGELRFQEVGYRLIKHALLRQPLSEPHREVGVVGA